MRIVKNIVRLLTDFVFLFLFVFVVYCAVENFSKAKDGNFIKKNRYEKYGAEFCPQCKKHDVGEYFYGMYRGIENEPPEIQVKIKLGKMIPGGCIVYEGAPRFRCNDCGFSW